VVVGEFVDAAPAWNVGRLGSTGGVKGDHEGERDDEDDNTHGFGFMVARWLHGGERKNPGFSVFVEIPGFCVGWLTGIEHVSRALWAVARACGKVDFMACWRRLLAICFTTRNDGCRLKTTVPIPRLFHGRIEMKRWH
ncbi:hypothetical protein R3J22_10260, partial [Trueperella bernardiae]|uniref:hypothetical protein n=1 Tax=Trueperella bernardiae TaxID=59561 RepID=UPI00294A9505